MDTTTVSTSKDSTGDAVLLMAMDLSRAQWELGFTIGMGQKARRRRVAAGCLKSIEREIELAKKRFGLSREAAVLCCYEAGRDGFWVYRALTEEVGVSCLVVDSASIEVKRGRKHRKSDGLDVEGLLRQLARYRAGEKKAFSVVNVPSAQMEDMRQLHRELLTLKGERTAMCNRIRSLLVTQGCPLWRWRKKTAREEIRRLRTWDGQKLGANVGARIERELDRLDVLTGQIEEIERQQIERLSAQVEQGHPMQVVARLMELRGVGIQSAWVLALEALAWRAFKNRKQVGGCFGLAPTPFQSGETNHDRGISKAGSVWVRKLAIELAWGWLRWQPNSELTRWFAGKFGGGGSRQRRRGIVALARKLMVALWRFAENGEVPRGAIVRRANGSAGGQACCGTQTYRLRGAVA